MLNDQSSDSGKLGGIDTDYHDPIDDGNQFNDLSLDNALLTLTK